MKCKLYSSWLIVIYFLFIAYDSVDIVTEAMRVWSGSVFMLSVASCIGPEVTENIGY